MAKRPNAANLTHGLAQLGGGSLKEGGSGMIGGIQTVFKVGVQIGNKYGLEGKDLSKSLDTVATLFLERH